MLLMRDGQPKLRFQHRRIHEWPPEGGFSTVCESVPEEEHAGLFELSVRLLQKLDWTGAALILLAIGMFVLEATVASHGILALGGIVAMVAGALMLVRGPIPQLRIQLGTTLAVAIPLAFITVFLVRLVYLSHQRKSVTGEEGMIGELGVAKSAIHNDGKVLVHGEHWNAFSEKPIPAGSRVRVVNLHGLRVEVEAVDDVGGPAGH